MERIPNEFSNLSLKIDDLKSVIDKFVSIRNLDISEIEIASAKTITKITKNLSEKIEACSCSKQDKKSKYKNLKYYSPPSVDKTIGNKELLLKKNTTQLINWPSK